MSPKNKNRICKVGVIAFLILTLAASESIAAEIKKAVPFATMDAVRIEVVVDANDGVSDLEVWGRIFPYPQGETLWEGQVSSTKIYDGNNLTATQQISDLKPRVWTPASPNLYNLTITVKKAGQAVAEQNIRFGFRSFETRDGRLLLNGKPIFLRGNAINPPGRGIPKEVENSRAFAEAYIKYLKSINVNCIRVLNDQMWLDLCDELGMLVAGGNYAGSVEEGGTKFPPSDFEAAANDYRNEKLGPLASHPSVVIYFLTNETAYKDDESGRRWTEFLKKMCAELKNWDSTRLYIGNAGYGFGRAGDICDIHRYWGWYYNSFLTFLNLRYNSEYVLPDKVQPLTFTECVGNYTGVDGRYNLCSNTKQPASQANWTGHAPQSEQAGLALRQQAFTVKQATEMFRRLRPINPELSGVFPFTIIFHNWSEISSFEDMTPKPAAQQLGVSYQPVLLSWELWTTQVYAGGSIQPVAHIVNDSDDFNDITGVNLVYEVKDKQGKTVAGGRTEFGDVKYYEVKSKPITIELPADLSTGDYVLFGRVYAGDKVISQNEEELFIAEQSFGKSKGKPEKKIFLYDPNGKTAKAIEKLGIEFDLLTGFDNLNPDSLLIIGEDCGNQELYMAADRLKEFARSGGRILCLRQAENKQWAIKNWLPVGITTLKYSANNTEYPSPERPYKDGSNINPERPDHPVFDGVGRQRLILWSDYSRWNQTNDEFPKVYPVTNGFKLANEDGLAVTAILADYCHGLEGIALAEMFSGNGSVILSGFDLVGRSGLDPVADKLLGNMIFYAASKEGHYAHPFIDSPIKWGEFETEKGVITGDTGGLILNTKPIIPPSESERTKLIVDHMGFQYAGKRGGWNSRPGIQYVPYGRRMFGPFDFTRGGNPNPLDAKSQTGTGIFHARIPAGKKTVLTKVENPAGEALAIEVEINGQKSAAVSIPAGQTMIIKTDMPKSSTEVSVRYTGGRKLVLLETAFE